MIIENVLWIAIAVYFEARNQELPGKEVVAYCVMNRAVKRKLSPKEVVRQKKQFSFYNARVIPPIKEGLAFIDCVQVAAKCFIKHKLGYRAGSIDHYYDKSLESNPPRWAATMKSLGRVGDFYIFRS